MPPPVKLFQSGLRPGSSCGRKTGGKLESRLTPVKYGLGVVCGQWTGIDRRWSVIWSENGL